MTRKRGFTLIELRVVISIIVLLLSILSSLLRKVKAAVCKSSLRQLGLAMRLYANANIGGLPAYIDRNAGYYWMERIASLVDAKAEGGEIQTCILFDCRVSASGLYGQT